MARGAGLSGGAGWLLLSAVLGGLALLLWLQPTSPWDWQPARAATEPWRWWTAAGVHWSSLHLAANGVGLVLVAALGWQAGCGRAATLAWAAAWPLTQLGLLLQPALRHYGGLSGVLHAGVAVAGCQLLAAGPGRRRWIGAALLAGLGCKLLLEAPWRGPLVASPGWDILIAPLAHVTGAAAGLLCGAVALGWLSRCGRPGRAA